MINILEVGAATLDRKVADFAKENCLSNFEFLSCIPGTIGGAITMNSVVIITIFQKFWYLFRAIDTNKFREIEIKKEDIDFIYRGNNLSNDLIIISAKFKGKLNRKKI